jgi:hypothetical protein
MCWAPCSNWFWANAVPLASIATSRPPAAAKRGKPYFISVCLPRCSPRPRLGKFRFQTRQPRPTG